MVYITKDGCQINSINSMGEFKVGEILNEIEFLKYQNILGIHDRSDTKLYCNFNLFFVFVSYSAFRISAL